MTVDSRADLRRTLHEALGASSAGADGWPFASFDYEPVASASIAQVHSARLASTGQRVAVKVQHRGIDALMRGDLRACARIVRFVGWLNDDFMPLVTVVPPCHSALQPL